MKPDNWGKLTPKTKQRLAEDLLNTTRGKYVVSQALALATLQLRTAPRLGHASSQEKSNLEDMEMLRETLFDLPIFTEGRGVIW